MEEEKEIAVYFFMGFLESGKTKFIQDTLEDERMDSGENTLLLVMEEGEEEYDPSRFKVSNVYMHTFSDKSELTCENLTKLEKEYDVDRVIIEYNGMWLLQEFFDAMPENWAINQLMTFFDSSTFLTYNANMRQLVFDKITMTQMVVFNRFSDKLDKLELHKVVRAISRRPDIVYERIGGKAEFDDIVDPLPFDVNKPIVEIEDKDFAYFYRDLSENAKDYEGKMVKFKGIVATSNKIPENSIVVGRFIMTCCEADIAYDGFACELKSKPDVKTKDWVVITAKITMKKHAVYRGVGPVLEVQTMEKVEPLEGADSVATYY